MIGVTSRTTVAAPPAPGRFRIGFAHRGTRRYDDCVELVKKRYRDRYGAEVDPRPDLFVTAWESGHGSAGFGQIVGVAGLTCAVDRPLRSEAYLAVPVEEACEVYGVVGIDRRNIAEMGPLVSLYPGCALFLMRNLPQLALYSGFDFLLSTLTDQLHHVARQAGWEFRTLTNARRADLSGADGGNWGTYYESRPRTGILRCGNSASLSAAS